MALPHASIPCLLPAGAHPLQVSRSTRVEVVTEGLFLRRLQQDPTLEVRHRQHNCWKVRAWKDMHLVHIFELLPYTPHLVCRPALPSCNTHPLT